MKIKQPQAVKETGSPFLALWPHRFDFLYAEHPKPGQRPEWFTETRHPLSDRLITQGSFLYGVRFGKKTRYALLDIDKGSPYHPDKGPEEIQRICEVLEPLGLVSHITIKSSYSRGLHLYFPFEKELSSWEIATGIETLLENAGFKIAPGLLEIFPNPKPFTSDGNLSLYNGHRLPMQQGSYLLDEEFFPIYSTQETFVQLWAQVAEHNCIDKKLLALEIKKKKRLRFHVTQKAEKFLNDLNAEIETGWTGPSQTNHILGRITIRSYVFGHVLSKNNKEPLKGKALIEDIIRIAKKLPGFKDFCNHRHELKKRATEWARCIEGGDRYYAYGGKKLSQIKDAVSKVELWNEQQTQSAKDRIKAIINRLIQKNQLPEGTTARFKAITGPGGVSGKTAYKYKEEWHPEHFSPENQNPEEKNEKPSEAEKCLGAFSASRGKSLLEGTGCNTSPEKNYSSSEQKNPQSIGCNVHLEQKPVENAKKGEFTSPPKGLRERIQEHIRNALELQKKKRLRNA